MKYRAEYELADLLIGNLVNPGHPKDRPAFFLKGFEDVEGQGSYFGKEGKEKQRVTSDSSLRSGLRKYLDDTLEKLPDIMSLSREEVLGFVEQLCSEWYRKMVWRNSGGKKCQIEGMDPYSNDERDSMLTWVQEVIRVVEAFVTNDVTNIGETLPHSAIMRMGMPVYEKTGGNKKMFIVPQDDPAFRYIMIYVKELNPASDRGVLEFTQYLAQATLQRAESLRRHSINVDKYGMVSMQYGDEHHKPGYLCLYLKVENGLFSLSEALPCGVVDSRPYQGDGRMHDALEKVRAEGIKPLLHKALESHSMQASILGMDFKDVKPSNIIILKDGSCVPIDYGDVHPVTSLGLLDFHTITTVRFAPPEHFLASSDVPIIGGTSSYQFGFILLEALMKTDPLNYIIKNCFKKLDDQTFYKKNVKMLEEKWTTDTSKFGHLKHFSSKERRKFAWCMLAYLVLTGEVIEDDSSATDDESSVSNYVTNHWMESLRPFVKDEQFKNDCNMYSLKAQARELVRDDPFADAFFGNPTKVHVLWLSLHPCPWIRPRGWEAKKWI